MNRDELTQFKLQRLVSEHDKYDFDKFLEKVRKVQGLNRKVVCEDLNMSITKLFYFEHGYFKYYPKYDDLTEIEEYYGLPRNILVKKVDKYVAEGKNKRYKSKQAYEERLQLSKESIESD